MNERAMGLVLADGGMDESGPWVVHEQPADRKLSRRMHVFDILCADRRRSARAYAAVVLTAVLAVAGCTTAGALKASAAPTIGTFEVTTAWPDNGYNPRTHSCEGDRSTPPVSWTGAPSETAEFVLIMEDNSMGNVQWVVVRIPGGPSGSLPERIQRSTTESFRSTYASPCPAPTQEDQYILTLYAL